MKKNLKWQFTGMVRSDGCETDLNTWILTYEKGEKKYMFFVMQSQSSGVVYDNIYLPSAITRVLDETSEGWQTDRLESIELEGETEEGDDPNNSRTIKALDKIIAGYSIKAEE